MIKKSFSSHIEIKSHYPLVADERIVYQGNLFVAPALGVFRFTRPDGSKVADCTNYESLMAAHRLLTGAAEP